MTIKNLISRTQTVVNGESATRISPGTARDRLGVHIFNASDTYDLGVRPDNDDEEPEMTSLDDASLVIPPHSTVFLAYARPVHLYAINGSNGPATSTATVEELG